MVGPNKSVTVAGNAVVVIGTIAGFVPDASRVTEAIQEAAPSVVALGISPLDLEALEALAASADPAGLMAQASHAEYVEPAGAPGLESLWVDRRVETEPEPASDGTGTFAPLTAHDERFLELLAHFGETGLPSPDLSAGHAAAGAVSAKLVSIDIDDQAHTEMFTRTVGIRHLVQRTRARKKAMLLDPSTCSDAYDLARKWDDVLTKPKPLAAIEAARERFMADEILRLAGKGSVVAVVPAPRFPGIVGHLDAR